MEKEEDCDQLDPNDMNSGTITVSNAQSYQSSAGILKGKTSPSSNGCFHLLLFGILKAVLNVLLIN